MAGRSAARFEAAPVSHAAAPPTRTGQLTWLPCMWQRPRPFLCQQLACREGGGGGGVPGRERACVVHGSTDGRTLLASVLCFSRGSEDRLDRRRRRRQDGRDRGAKPVRETTNTRVWSLTATFPTSQPSPLGATSTGTLGSRFVKVRKEHERKVSPSSLAPFAPERGLS